MLLSVNMVVEFNREAGKIQYIFAPSEHPERICSYLVRQFEVEPAKIGHFQISKLIFEAKYDSIFLKPKFLFEYQIRGTTFIQRIFSFKYSCKTLFSKNVPYFYQLCIKLSYKIQKKIHSACSFWWKNTLNFAHLPMKFHNQGLTNVGSWLSQVVKRNVNHICIY